MRKKGIAIIDYGMGNLMSVSKAVATIYDNAYVTDSKNKILNADAIILPGVGAFNDAIKNLRKLKLINVIVDSVKSGKPFFGICLGLQLLFTKSEEYIVKEGLNIIKGVVRRFPLNIKLKVPQIGWNQINIKKRCCALKGVPDASFVYFVHSYYSVPEDKRVIATETTYGIKYPSSICKDNIFATQFHPEKSQKVGLAMFKNFVENI